MMNFKIREGLFFLFFLSIISLCYSSDVLAKKIIKLNIGIMQDQIGASTKYLPIKKYMLKKSIKVNFIEFNSYRQAASKFAEGTIDAMFSGSAVAGIFILKDLAIPVIRPLRRDGGSHYFAVLISKIGTKKYNGMPAYFKGKKIAFSALASSGEFYYKSITNYSKYKANEILKTFSHGEAIDALMSNKADVAIVKNILWEKVKNNYKGIIKVGEDFEQNPDNVLIFSKKRSLEDVDKVRKIFLAINSDIGEDARILKKSMNVFGFVKTTIRDFKHTLEILNLAGVDKNYIFSK